MSYTDFHCTPLKMRTRPLHMCKAFSGSRLGGDGGRDASCCRPGQQLAEK